MPEWMLESDDYIPVEDNGNFINKSILSIMKLLSKVSGGSTKNALKVNAAIKMICAIALIVSVSLSRSLLYTFLVMAYILFKSCLLSVDGMKSVIGRSIMVGVFTGIILIPSMLMGNARNSILMILKVLVCIMEINILSQTTEWREITSSLKFFFVPDIFIFVLDITFKYIRILGEFSLNMLYSLKLRSVGKNANKYSSVSGIMGTMFIKSKEMAEDMYKAMECRGFSGEYIRPGTLKLDKYDSIYVIINLMLILTCAYL